MLRLALHHTRSLRNPIATLSRGPFSIQRQLTVPFSSSNTQAVTVDVNSDGIAIIRLDTPNSKVNVLSKQFNEELEKAITQVQSDPDIKAAVLLSSKPDNFIAGADINMLSACKSSEELANLSKKGQQMLNRLASGKPIVAAINGSCLGGGLEVALACHYRIASESEKTVLGLPEVKLGLLPGAGGTQRLPRQIGLLNSLDLILTGKNVFPPKAKKLKLVDQLADPHALEQAAIDQAISLAKKPQAKPKDALLRTVTEKIGFVRNYVLGKARETVLKQTKGKYPAPLKALEAISAGFEHGVEKGLQVEAENFGALGQTPESKALVTIFNASTSLKKNPYGKPAQEVKTIAVVGAGLMGAGISQVSLDKGFRVVLKDVSQTALARGEKQIYATFQEKVKKRQISSFVRDKKLAGLVPLVDNDQWAAQLKRTDLLVEAVLEDLALKHRVIQQVEQHLPAHAVIATNTSAIPISSIAQGSKRPENVVGMHYFSPVEKMPLLEVILGDQTSHLAAAAAVQVGLRQGKTVIVVKDVPGFYVNRSLGPYMDEVMALLSQGADLEKIDKAMRDFGFPVGPISLADEVGLDVAYHVQHTLKDALGVRMSGGDESIMKALLDKKFLGRKTGKGFFTYPATKQKPSLFQKLFGGKKPSKEVFSETVEILKSLRKNESAANLTVEQIQERLVGRLINEAIFCLQDKIIASPTDGDIGLVFGLGFPPFLGGPFRYVDSIGTDKFYDRLKRLSEQYGPQFEPAPMLKELNGAPFHKKE